VTKIPAFPESTNAPVRPQGSEPAHVNLLVQCAHCRGAVELECVGLSGFWGHRTYNEYSCPHCRKQNHERTAGTIVSAAAAVDRRLTT
jgi:hypothetical protein